MKLRHSVVLLALGSLLFATNLVAKDRPDYDALANSNASKSLPAAAQERSGKLVKHGAAMHIEQRLGVPTLLFASAAPGEGKTFCAVNYAASLALYGVRVHCVPSVHALDLGWFSIAITESHLYKL